MSEVISEGRPKNEIRPRESMQARSALALLYSGLLGIDLPRARDLGPILLIWAASLRSRTVATVLVVTFAMLYTLCVPLFQNTFPLF